VKWSNISNKALFEKGPVMKDGPVQARIVEPRQIRSSIRFFLPNIRAFQKIDIYR
jgi:hypothetical protein